MNRFYLVVLAPAILCILLFSTAATALLATPLYSRIELGIENDSKKCLFATITDTRPYSVRCANHSSSDVRLRFVFDQGTIKLYKNPRYCIYVIQRPFIVNDFSLTIDLCLENVSPLFTKLYTFTLHTNPSRISWNRFPDKVFTASGSDGVELKTYNRNSNQNWGEVYPIVKLLELDGSNVCAEAPLTTEGNRVRLVQMFAAKCNVTNVNQQFIIHPNGMLELADGSLATRTGHGWCVGVVETQLGGTQLQTYDCGFYIGSEYSKYQIFTFEDAHIVWKHKPELAFGIDNSNPEKPLLELYPYVQDDFTMKWRPSLGDAQVMFKLAADNTNLCLDTSTVGNDLQVAVCKVDTAETCSDTPVDPALNVAQSFVLRESDGSAAALMLVDGSNTCVEVAGGVTADSTRVITGDCDFSAKQMFTIDSVDQKILGLGKALTLVGDTQEPDSLIEISTWDLKDSQKWDMLPARVRKCPRTCSFGGHRVGSADMCIEGLCGLDEDLVNSGRKAVCCGADGIDSKCLNEGANLGAGIISGNWCMTCSGHTSTGPTGCSIPIPPPSKPDTSDNGLVPNATTHIRCSYDNLADNNIAFFNPNEVKPNLTYLALTGSNIGLSPSSLSVSFPNLTHLDLAGSNVDGFLFESKVVETWIQLEYVNVSDCTRLGANDGTLFHSNLSPMSNLSVLDMSSIVPDSPFKLRPLMSLTSLEELHLNHNNLASLPDDFFLKMTKLTKLRIGGNPMGAKLPLHMDKMPNLRILDLSLMDLSLPLKLEPLMSLTSLEELHLNHNNLASLPDNFFDKMLKLTKLRIRNNPMKVPLPVGIYDRTIPVLDSDVFIGDTPASTITSSPTISPVEQIASPTLAPSKMPTTTSPTSTFSPTATFSPTLTSILRSTIEPTTTLQAKESQPAGVIAGSVIGVLIVIVVAVVMVKKKAEIVAVVGKMKEKQSGADVSIGVLVSASPLQNDEFVMSQTLKPNSQDTATVNVVVSEDPADDSTVSETLEHDSKNIIF